MQTNPIVDGQKAIVAWYLQAVNILGGYRMIDNRNSSADEIEYGLYGCIERSRMRLVIIKLAERLWLQWFIVVVTVILVVALYWSKLWSNALKTIVLVQVKSSRAKSTLQDLAVTKSLFNNNVFSYNYTVPAYYYTLWPIGKIIIVHFLYNAKSINYRYHICWFWSWTITNFWRANFWLEESRKGIGRVFVLSG